MFITLPTPAELIAGIKVWSVPFLADIWPLIVFAIGIFFVVYSIPWLIDIFKDGFRQFGHHKINKYEDLLNADNAEIAAYVARRDKIAAQNKVREELLARAEKYLKP